MARATALLLAAAPRMSALGLGLMARPSALLMLGAAPPRVSAPRGVQT